MVRQADVHVCIYISVRLLPSPSDCINLISSRKLGCQKGSGGKSDKIASRSVTVSIRPAACSAVPSPATGQLGDHCCLQGEITGSNEGTVLHLITSVS